MDGGDTVGAVRADDRQVGHSHFGLRTLFDQAHPRNAGVVVRITAPHLVQKTPVDLEDDLQLPRDDLLEVMQRPSLQRLGQ